MINFSADLIPVTFKRVRSNGTRRFNDKNYSEFKIELGYIAKAAMQGRPPLKGALKLSADIYQKFEPTALKAGDWDNHAKAVCDALNGICYLDDRQIVDGHISLFKGKPRICISIEEINHD